MAMYSLNFSLPARIILLRVPSLFFFFPRIVVWTVRGHFQFEFVFVSIQCMALLAPCYAEGKNENYCLLSLQVVGNVAFTFETIVLTLD